MRYGNKTFSVTLGGPAFSKNWEATFRGGPPSELEAPKPPEKEPPSPHPTPEEIVSQGWSTARSLHRGVADF